MENIVFQYIEDIHALIFDPDRLPASIIALLFVSLSGLLWRGWTHNVVPYLWQGVDFLFSGLGSRLNLSSRSFQHLVFRGFFVITLALCLAAFLAKTLLEGVPRSWSLIGDVFALSLSMSSGRVWIAQARLYKGLKSPALVKGAFLTLSRSTRMNLVLSDEYTITRLGVVLGVRQFDKAVVLPIMWYLIGGIPALFMASSLTALAWRFGRDGYGGGFAAPILALEKLMGFVPTVFSGLLVALAGVLTPTAGMFRALSSLLFPLDGKGKAPYAEGGAPITALAYALGVSLGGPLQDSDGVSVQNRWVGPPSSTARLEARHLYRAIYATVMAHFLFLSVLLGGFLLHAWGASG